MSTTHYPTLSEWLATVADAYARHYEDTGEVADTVWLSGSAWAYWEGLIGAGGPGGASRNSVGPFRVVRSDLPFRAAVVGVSGSDIPKTEVKL